MNRDDAQIVLVDTPGIHRPENVLSRQMMDELQHALEGIEVLSLIVDASSTDFGPGDRFSIEWVQRFHGPVFLLLNKVDTVNKPLLLPLIERYRQAYEFAEIFPISALTGVGCDDLVNAWIARLPEASAAFSAGPVHRSAGAFSRRGIGPRAGNFSHARRSAPRPRCSS